MTTIASAPGKIILFGEHAVVYGKPAIAAAITLRTRVKAEKTDGNKVMITSFPLKKRETVLTQEIVEETRVSPLAYCFSAVKQAYQLAGFEKGLKIEISSSIPPDSGLGSSAAVSVAVLAATLGELGLNLEKEKLAKVATQVERDVQGVSSGLDPTTSSHGGFLYYKQGEIIQLGAGEELRLVTGYSGQKSSTKKQVELVKARLEEYPDIIGPTIETIGRIVDRGREALEKGETARVGRLMVMNQWCLELLGVSTPKLRRLVGAALEAGAEGAKITGAGGGGSIIALALRSEQKVQKAIEKAGGAPLSVGIDKTGVQVSKIG
ncbi:MAG: mevalonate kinase [Methanobacteriota archaeon]|nr:MAG: mevalonate kinase [Euryarchaeota archaeon]